MRFLKIALFASLMAFRAFGASAEVITFTIGPNPAYPGSTPDGETITGVGMVTLGAWDEAQGRWQCSIEYAQATVGAGVEWLNAGIGINGTGAGVTKVVFYPQPGPNTAVTYLLPATTYTITAGGDNGFGSFATITRQLTTPPRPTFDPTLTRPTDPKARPDSCPAGMAVANAHLALCSLNIMDRPMTYAPPYGPGIDFTLTYNHREAGLPTGTFGFSNLGAKWTHNWLGYVDEETFTVFPAVPGSVANPHSTPPTPASPGIAARMAYRAKVTLPGGGYDTYSPNPSEWFYADTAPPTTASFTNRHDSAIKLFKVLNGYEQRNPDGSKYVFGLPFGVSGGTRYLLTQFVDRMGLALTLAYDSSNRITSFTDASGRVTTLSYTDSDPFKITRITDPYGRFCTMTYTGGRLTKITDVIGLESQFAYTGDFIHSLTTPYGTSTFAYGESGNDRWLTLTDPAGGVERLEFRENLGATVAYGPVPTGAGAIPATDDQKRYTLYWSKKAMLDQPGAVASAHLYHWYRGKDSSFSGAVMDEKRALEGRVFYKYSGESADVLVGTPSRKTVVARVLDDSTSQIYQYGYDSFGNLIQTTDPLGRQTTMIYDANGIDLLEVRQKTGPNSYDVVKKYTYNSQHNAETVTDASGYVTAFTYNTAGQVRTITNAKGEATDFWYHADGLPENFSLNSNATGHLIQVDVAASDAILKFHYNQNGQVYKTFDSEGFELTNQYDLFDRTTKVLYPDGTFEEVTYDRLDVKRIRDRRGLLRNFTYNNVRQLVSVTDPGFRTTRYNWCACGLLVSALDPEGSMTKWVYDIQGRLTERTFADGRSDKYYYRASSGIFSELIDAKGQSTRYHYNGDRSLSRVEYINSLEPTPAVSFTYDTAYLRVLTMTDASGVTGYSYNGVSSTPTAGAGRLAVVNGPLANDDVTYGYDELGRIILKTIGGANQISTSYDSLGRVTTLANLLGTFSLSYLGDTGQIASIGYPNSQLSSYLYYSNANGRRLHRLQNLSPSGGVISAFEYSYDPEGMILSWSRQIDASLAKVSKFKYDLVDQLIDAEVPSLSGSTDYYAYRYDRAGNRIGEQVNNEPTAASHNAVNQLTSLGGLGLVRFAGTLSESSLIRVNNRPAYVDGGNLFRSDVPLNIGQNTVNIKAEDRSGNVTEKNYQVSVGAVGARSLSYDANGNMLNNGAGHIYSWDGANRLIRITLASGVVDFVYDGFGRRVQEKWNGSIIKHWIWSDGTQPDEERDASNVVTKRFYPGFGQKNGSDSYFYTTDHLGSIREMTDATGAVRARYDYDPFGRVAKVSGDLDADFGFAGFQRHQASSLHLSWYRAYDPNLGRWLNRDPIGENGGANLYRAVNNNPINNIDPYGLVDCSDLERVVKRSEETIKNHKSTIRRLMEKIAQRTVDQMQGTRNIPYSHPNETEKPGSSVVGHDFLIEKDIKSLEDQRRKLANAERVLQGQKARLGRCYQEVQQECEAKKPNLEAQIRAAERGEAAARGVATGAVIIGGVGAVFLYPPLALPALATR